MLDGASHPSRIELGGEMVVTSRGEGQAENP